MNNRECLPKDIHHLSLPLLEALWFGQSAPQPDCQINHKWAFRDDFSAPCKPSQMMSSVAVIAFSHMSSALPNNMTFRRENLSKRIPIICVKNTVFQMLNLCIESSECCAITITENPGNSSPATAVKSFDEPKFCFFDCMKCHISSNSI